MRVLFHIVISAFCVSLYSISAYAVSEIAIKVQHFEHPQGNAQNVALHLNLSKPTLTLSANVVLKQKSEKDWIQLNLGCEIPENAQFGAFNCADSSLKNSRINLPFSLEINQLFSHGVPDV